VELFHVERSFSEAPLEPGDTELREVLACGLDELGLATGPKQLERWEKLARLLDRWGQRINLTGHRGALAIARNLLLEAAALSQVLPDARTLADLGSGAGIPGLPLAICRPDCTVRLVESRERRHHFQRAAIRELGLANVEALHGRAEELEIRLSDGVIAQGMAQPEKALRWMRPWAAAGGWVALATVPGTPAQRHPDLEQGQVLRYSAPHRPERAVWVAWVRCSGTAC
jgi:16S rRNA (guanine527-N7)-methyltransferase